MAGAVSAQGHLPSADITIQSMYAQADWVVKSVMWIFVLASVVSLSIGLYKGWEVLVRRRRMSATWDLLTVAPGLEAAKDIPDSAARAMVHTALGELERYPKACHQGPLHSEGIKERVAAVIQRIGASRQRQLSRGVSVLRNSSGLYRYRRTSSNGKSQYDGIETPGVSAPSPLFSLAGRTSNGPYS